MRICQGIHGGIGFMMEFDLQLWYRRVCAWTMRLGTAYEHRAKVARALLDRPGQVILGRPVPVVAEGLGQSGVISRRRSRHGSMSGMRPNR